MSPKGDRKRIAYIQYGHGQFTSRLERPDAADFIQCWSIDADCLACTTRVLRVDKSKPTGQTKIRQTRQACRGREPTDPLHDCQSGWYVFQFLHSPTPILGKFHWSARCPVPRGPTERPTRYDSVHQVCDGCRQIRCGWMCSRR